jgi:hypothetical protein
MDEQYFGHFKRGISYRNVKTQVKMPPWFVII